MGMKATSPLTETNATLAKAGRLVHEPEGVLLKLWLYPSAAGGVLYLLVVGVLAPLRRFLHKITR
jgi:hypothetical protein